MSYFGIRLRYLRKQDNLTQQQLADKLGMAKSSISMYENGHHEPDFETLEKIADFFNVPTGTFFPDGSNEVLPVEMKDKIKALRKQQGFTLEEVGNTVGERIKARRKELGMNADRLAELIGVERSTVFRYEKGDIEKLSGDVLGPICQVLNISPAYLMGWEENPAPAATSFPFGAALSAPPRLASLTVAFSQLNDEGQEKVVDYANDLIDTGRYAPRSEAKHA